MDLVFRVDEDNKSKLDAVLDEDPVSRLSITQRNSDVFDLDVEGILVLLEGDEETCEGAREEISSFGEELKGEEKEEVIEAFKAEEEEAAEGFGSIFGG